MGRMLHEAEPMLSSRQTSDMTGQAYPSLSSSDPNARTDPAPHPSTATAGKNDAVLYTVSDAALLKNIGQYRSQGKDAGGKVVQIVS